MPRHKTKTAAAPKPDRLDALIFGYLQLADEHFPHVPLSGLNVAQLHALRCIAERTGASAPEFLAVAVKEWPSVAAAIKRADETAEWKIPCPSLCAINKHFDAVAAWMQSSGYAITPRKLTSKARRAVPVFDPPLQPYDADEDDDDVVIIGEGASGDEAATA